MNRPDQDDATAFGHGARRLDAGVIGATHVDVEEPVGGAGISLAKVAAVLGTTERMIEQTYGHHVPRPFARRRELCRQAVWEDRSYR